METQRIDKILSHHGYGTRKDVKKLLRSGVVKVNNEVCYNANMHICIQKDTLQINDEVLQIKSYVYLMMNKCQDVVCSNKDGLHKTVFDLLDEKYKIDFMEGALHTVGRLDIDTEGLLILTNDGTLTHKLTSPKTHVPKTYFVRLSKSLTEEEQNLYTSEFSKGLNVPSEGNEEGFLAKSANLEWINCSEVNITITEGKYHQVKRMFLVMNNPIIYLKRIKMGTLTLDPQIPLGSYRELTTEEMELLKQ